MKVYKAIYHNNDRGSVMQAIICAESEKQALGLLQDYAYDEDFKLDDPRITDIAELSANVETSQIVNDVALEW